MYRIFKMRNTMFPRELPHIYVQLQKIVAHAFPEGRGGQEMVHHPDQRGSCKEHNVSIICVFL